MQISTLIIDDEPLARQRLENLVVDVPEIQLLDSCKTGKEAIAKIDELKPELIFLDIQMKDMTGFNVLEQIIVPKKPLVIFVTAYDEFALKAFDYFAFDYLLKPFKDERFFKSAKNAIDVFKHDGHIQFEEKIEGLLKSIQDGKDMFRPSHNNKLPIKTGNKIYFIENQEIKYITASRYYAEIHTDQKKHLLRESLTNLMENLNNGSFIRIHRSTIINLRFIGELINSNYGEIDVKMTDGQLFRISKGYKKEFIQKMGI
jgi:two-component system LytT family response regulator